MISAKLPSRVSVEDFLAALEKARLVYVATCWSASGAYAWVEVTKPAIKAGLILRGDPIIYATEDFGNLYVGAFG